MNCIDCRYSLLKDGHSKCTYEEGECIKISLLEKENADLREYLRNKKLAVQNRNSRIKELEKENAKLNKQIEKMKCCENCRWEEPSSFCDGCKRLKGQIFSDVITNDNWELRR